MSDMKARYYVTPSSIASYFGVGFNDPRTQFEIDSGREGNVFDDDALDRIELGKELEDATLNYFQNHVFKTPITNRNSGIIWGYDNQIKMIIDGEMEIDGEKIGVENKISNSNSYKFTDNMGYIFQVQTYMLVLGYSKFVLCGLHHGKPVFKFIDRDDEMIEDIKTMVSFVSGALVGVNDFEREYPTELLEKYSGRPILPLITDITDDAKEYFMTLADLNAKKKEIEDSIKVLKMTYGEVETMYDKGVYEDDNIKVTLNSYERKGAFDPDALLIDFPDLDLSKYYKPSTEVRTTRLIKKAVN